MADPTSPKSLWELARLYTAGQLSAGEMEAFEAHLAVDQQARDALVAAVQGEHGPDADVLRPNPAYRAEVLRRLTPHPFWTWLRRLTASTSPRANWTLAGAALALVLLLTASMLVAPSIQSVETPVVQPSPVSPAAPLVQKPVCTIPEIPWQQRARDHLVKVPDEEAARKLKPGGTRRDSPMMP